MTDREGPGVGRARARCPPTASWCAPTPRPGPWSRRARRAGRADPGRSGCSAATCAARSAAAATSDRLRSGRRDGLPVDLGSVLVDGRLHWFVAHLVARRGWWRGPGRGGHERPVARPVGRRAAGPPRRRPARRARRPTCALGDRLKARRRLRLGHPRARTRHRRVAESPAPQLELRPADPDAGSTASGSAGPAPCRSGSSPTPSPAWSDRRRPVRTSAASRRRVRAYGRGMQAWILDESPGQLPLRRDRRPDGRARRRARSGWSASALNHMDLWVTQGRPSRQLPARARAATWPAWSTRWGTRVAGVAVGDEVVVNPAVSPARARSSRTAIDAPMCPGLPDRRRAPLGRPRRATSSCRPATCVPRPPGRSWAECAAYPLAHAHRLAACCAGPGCGPARPCWWSASAAGVSTAAPRPRPPPGRRRCYVTSRDRGQAPTRRWRSGPSTRFDSDGRLAGRGRRRGRERRPGHLGPVDRGAAAGRPHRGRAAARRGPTVELHLPTPLLQASTRSSARRWAATSEFADVTAAGRRRASPVARRRRASPLDDVPRRRSTASSRAPSSARSSSATTFARDAPSDPTRHGSARRT